MEAKSKEDIISEKEEEVKKEKDKSNSRNVEQKHFGLTNYEELLNG